MTTLASPRLMHVLTLFLVMCGSVAIGDEAPAPPTPRRPTNDAELRYWLENMVWYHHYSRDEIQEATGLDAAAID